MSSIRKNLALVTAFLSTSAFCATAIAAPPDFAGSEFEPFAATVPCTDADPNPKYISCFFDVPPGKILHVERMDGWAANGSSVNAYRIPTIAPFANPNEFRWEANGDFYVSDNNTHHDPANIAHDMQVMIYSAGTGSRMGFCNIQGKLYDAPAQ